MWDRYIELSSGVSNIINLWANNTCIMVLRSDPVMWDRYMYIELSSEVSNLLIPCSKFRSLKYKIDHAISYHVIFLWVTNFFAL